VTRGYAFLRSSEIVVLLALRGSLVVHTVMYHNVLYCLFRMACIRMTCHAILADGVPSGFVCTSPDYRLRLDDGGYVYMIWHSYCGPEFYGDRDCYSRHIDDWWEDARICRALDWFTGRGGKA